jgi:protein-tyrosine phosphatase
VPVEVAPLNILFVCTANICRSPIAEALFRTRMNDLGFPVSVRSAGYLPAGAPAADLAIKVMADRGIDLSGHRSTRLTDDLLLGATLTLTMTSEHQRLAVDLEQRAWPRIFTLTEVCSRIAAVGPRQDRETARKYVERLHSGRLASQLINSGDAGDIADPYGGPWAGFERTADVLDHYTAQLSSALSGRSIPVPQLPDTVPAEVSVSSPSRIGRLFRRS